MPSTENDDDVRDGVDAVEKLTFACCDFVAALDAPGQVDCRSFAGRTKARSGWCRTGPLTKRRHFMLRS